LPSRIAAAIVLILILASRATAQLWERLGPVGGLVVSLGAASAGNVYLGTADGHIFASNDDGSSWELRGRVGNRLDAVVPRVLADPRDQHRLFAAVWYRAAGPGGGVFRSDDSGYTWSLVGLQGEEARALEFAPSKPDVLIAGTRSGVFRTVDGGKYWERISPAGDEELRNIDSLAIDPRTPETIYAGTYHLPWRTTDGGKTWKPVISGLIDDSDIMSLRVDVANPERLYMSACSGIYRSENQGSDWTKLQGIPYAARRTQTIVQDTGNPKTLYAGTTEGLWVTRDGGESWTRTTPKDWVVNGVAVLASSDGKPGRVILGTEAQGIEISDDGGETFLEANRGFSHVVVQQLLANRNDSGHLLMLTEQGGKKIQESRDGGRNWAPVALMTGAQEKREDLSVDGIQQIYSTPWGWLLRSGNGQLWTRDENAGVWKIWKLRLPAAALGRARNKAANKQKASAIRPPLSGSLIVAGQNFVVLPAAQGLLRCTSSGLCERLKFFGPGGTVHALWISSAGRDLVVLKDGKLGLSVDGGETASWRDLPVANEQVLWLDAAESGPPKIIFLGTSIGLFASQDAGASWQKAANGLPAGQMDLWLRAPGIWVASEQDGGMYISRDQGKSWMRVDRDSERGHFTGLVVTKNGALLAGSQSEGLLQLDRGAQ
jgi:photosystem II stability/assembly factor-like uncharacterized protein